MDQEIDLREYIAVLFKHKYWILGLAVVAAVGAAVASMLLRPVYEAVALVAVTRPQYEVQFDSRFEPVSGNTQPPYKAYPLLAASDEVVAALIADLGDELRNGERTVLVLRRKLRAQNSSDPSIVRLTVKDGNPTRAATIANRWAERLVQAANELYAQSSDELTFFTELQAEAEDALGQADQDLVDFQARNQAAILETQLLHAHTALTADLEAAHAMELLIQNARALRERLNAQESAAPASPSDELTALLIEINAFNYSSSEVQLQLSAQQDLGSKTVGDQITFLDSLILVLEARLVLLQEQTQALEPEILAKQSAYQEALAEQSRLENAQLLAQDNLLSLSRKAADARIAAQDTIGDVRLASTATPINDPVSPRKTLYTAAGGAAGLLLGIVIALAIEYWRRGQQKAASS